MKSIFCLIACVSLSLLFFSCSNGSGGEKFFSEETTIKESTSRRDDSVLWTRELESVRLLIDTKKNNGAADTLRLEPLSVMSLSSQGTPVYPILEGFGSLDTSDISAELRTFLDSFCTSVAAWSFSQELFTSESAFVLPLFMYDVKMQWKEAFSKDFPDVEAENPLFSSWLYGEPFADGSEFQIPVRLFCAYGYLDVLLYVRSASQFKIDALLIQKWGKK